MADGQLLNCFQGYVTGCCIVDVPDVVLLLQRKSTEEEEEIRVLGQDKRNLLVKLKQTEARLAGLLEGRADSGARCEQAGVCVGGGRGCGRRVGADAE